jgi:excisionase family DNA binding protein
MALAERLLTIPEVAILLRIGRAMVYKLIRRGDLPAVRQGNLFRVRGRGLIRYMERHARSLRRPRSVIRLNRRSA